MSTAGNPSNGNGGTTPGNDPKTALRLLKQQLLSQVDVPAQTMEHRKAVTHKEPIPELLQQLLERYRQAHRGLEIEPVTWLRFESQKKDGSPFDADEWPDDDALVILTHTETYADTTQIEVRTHVLVARKRK